MRASRGVWGLRLCLAGCLVWTCAACGDDSGEEGAGNNAAQNNAAQNNGDNNTQNNGGALPEGCDALVMPSAQDQEAIQGAFIDLEEGQTLCLGAGTFTLQQQLTLGQARVTLKGAGPEATILDFSAQDIGSNGVEITGDGVVVEDLQVQNTPGDGIRATEVAGITFRNVHVIWTEPGSTDNGAYGLYPVGSTEVLIEGCVVQGARDAGIYVGQSQRIIVRDNEARGNVAGIEIENSLDADVYNNHAHDNTGGLLVFNLPNLDLFGGRAKVHDNLIEGNNRDNFAEEGNIVSRVPRGTGMFILACDDNEIHDNTIQNNESIGLALVSFNPLLTGSVPDDPEFDIYPQGNWIHDNTFINNGTDPDTLVRAIAPEPPAPDLAWDGCVDEAQDDADGALANCISGNTRGEDEEIFYLNFDLCEQAGQNSTDLAPVTCEHEPLPVVELP